MYKFEIRRNFISYTFKMADSKSAGDAVESSQLMKADEAAEGNAKRENEENENGSDLLGIAPSQVCSPSILTPPRLLQPGHLLKKPSELNRSIFKSPAVLRPSQLNGNVGSSVGSPKPTFLLNPSRLNPFAKAANDEKNEEEQKEKCTTSSNTSAPKFLPLLQNGSKSEPATKTTTPTASTSTMASSNDFVFGQNIQDRVVSDNKLEDFKSTSCTNANGTSDMLFSSALKETSVPESGASVRPQSKSLSESAREYEESRAVKRKYEEVEVKTGEEGETNVLQITCKLFAFDKAGGGGWQERGRGNLRLNDQEAEDGTHSRLVFRASGSFRVVLNTKIWAEMSIQQASNKSIRLTAFDCNGEIKVFLLTGSPEDIKHLQKHLEVRVKKEMERQKSSKPASSLCPTETLPEPDLKKVAGSSEITN